MRWYIIRTLLHKELLRHLANRGGLAMALLLICASILLAFFSKRQQLPTTHLVGGVLYCYVDYGVQNPWIQHLRNHVPPELSHRIGFRSRNLRDGADLDYPQGAGAIQIRPGNASAEYRIVVKHRGNPLEMAPYEDWLWRETRRYFSNRAAEVLGRDQLPADLFTGDPLPARDGEEVLWCVNEAHRLFREQLTEAWQERNGTARTPLGIPSVAASRQAVTGVSQDIDLQTILASALILFGLFFTCVYLLPSLTCEERERGILLAQALTPASAVEILAAKFLFYPGIGILLGAILAGIYRPGVLVALQPVPRLGIYLPMFWLGLASSAAAFLGVGLTISSLAKTQRAASLGAMCYLLGVTLLVLICQINVIPFLTNLSVENHTTLLMRSVLAGQVALWNWGNLIWTMVLAVFWCWLAVWLFRKYGWQ